MGIHLAKQTNGKVTVSGTDACVVMSPTKPSSCSVTSSTQEQQQPKVANRKNSGKNNNGNSSNNIDDKNEGSTNSDEFTSVEIRRVRDTWSRLIGQADKYGEEVFLAIFELRPELRRFFPFRNIADKDLPANAIFRGHAMRFMRAIDLVVLHLDDLEVGASPSLVSLGKTHRRIPGFQHQDLWVFHSAMDVVWEKHIGEGYDAPTRAAWQKVFNVITAKMSEGHLTPSALPQRIAAPPPNNDVTAHAPQTDTANNNTSSTNSTVYHHSAGITPASASG